MTTVHRLSARTIATRSLLVGAGVVLLLALLAEVNGIGGPLILALWIACIAGSFMMAWTRTTGARWAWAALGTLLLVVLVGLFALTIPAELMPADAGAVAGEG